MNLSDKLKQLWQLRWMRGLLLLFLAFALGRCTALAPQPADPEQDQLTALDEMANCPDRLQALGREHQQLREELAYVKQSVVVEQEACFGVRETLLEKEDEINRLSEQLAFYRGIVSPEEAGVGVRIYSLKLDPLGRRYYQFRLTLVQPVRQAVDAKGKLAMRLVVIDSAGVTQSLDMADLLKDDDYAWKYQFRYYTEVYGQFQLPPEVTPVRIEVVATPQGRARKKQSQTYVWNELIAVDHGEASE